MTAEQPITLGRLVELLSAYDPDLPVLLDDAPIVLASLTPNHRGPGDLIPWSASLRLKTTR